MINMVLITMAEYVPLGLGDCFNFLRLVRTGTYIIAKGNRLEGKGIDDEEKS